jgi:hypothetical protein
MGNIGSSENYVPALEFKDTVDKYKIKKKISHEDVFLADFLYDVPLKVNYKVNVKIGGELVVEESFPTYKDAKNEVYCSFKSLIYPKNLNKDNTLILSKPQYQRYVQMIEKIANKQATETTGLLD